MTALTTAGIIAVIFLILLVGFISGRRIQNADDFLTGGGRATALMVCGALTGTMVGSQMTIGTTQLAFNFGISAWWFALGTCGGCLCLGLLYAIPLRHSDYPTMAQMIAGEYGARIGSLGSVLCGMGMFVNVLSQTIACTGLISTLAPTFTAMHAALLSVTLMCFYVIFGGTLGAGASGTVKLTLVYASMCVGVAVALKNSGGAAAMLSTLDHVLTETELSTMRSASVSSLYYNIVARGPLKDIGSGVSMVLGILSSQTYAQMVQSAKNDGAARRGCLLAAALVPPVGLMGIGIGIYMRTQYITRAEVDALLASGRKVPDLKVLDAAISALPVFVMDHLPPFFAGIVLGTMLIAIVATGAGIMLGLSSLVVKDILVKAFPGLCQKKRELYATRGALIVSAAAAALCAIVLPAGTLNDYGFLSMGLRATVIFFPLSAAFWLSGKIDARFVLASMILAPLTVIAGKALAIPIDSLMPGMAMSFLCCFLGFLWKKYAEKRAYADTDSSDTR